MMFFLATIPPLVRPPSVTRGGIVAPNYTDDFQYNLSDPLVRTPLFCYNSRRRRENFEGYIGLLVRKPPLVLLHFGTRGGGSSYK